MNDFAVADRLYGSDASKKALSSPLKSERWRCMPEPWMPSRGLGMNVACTLCIAAISFTIMRNVMMLSAMVRASVWRRSISCWLGASSWNEYSTEMPMASSVRIVSLRSDEATSVVVRSKKLPSSSGTGTSPGFGGAK